MSIPFVKCFFIGVLFKASPKLFIVEAFAQQGKGRGEGPNGTGSPSRRKLRCGLDVEKA
jgi:hypothetical protein